MIRNTSLILLTMVLFPAKIWKCRKRRMDLSFNGHDLSDGPLSLLIKT